MTQTIRHEDPRLTWQGAVSLQRTPEWSMPWRIPHEERGLFPPEGWQKQPRQSAGVRISFMSDTTSLAGEVEVTQVDAPVDIYCDGKFQQTLKVRDGRFASEELPKGDKLVEVWLPQLSEFRLRTFDISPAAWIVPYQDKRRRWIVYGSSITHCAAAQSPSYTWPGVVSRALDLNLTCLGFGSNCHLDPMIARMMAELPADYLTIKVGINVYSKSSLDFRTFQPAIIGFVKAIRDKKPDTPFAVISAIYAPTREKVENAVKFTIEAMRIEVADAVSRLQTHGDKHLYYFDGLKLIGPEQGHLLPDSVHPNAEGYKALGKNFIDEVWPTMSGKAAPARPTVAKVIGGN